MSELITIRPAQQEDLSARRCILQEAWLDAYSHIYTRQEINALFAGKLNQHSDWTGNRQEPIGAFVAESAGEIVGTTSFVRLTNGDAEMTTLHVKPEHQGQGIGRRLWNGVKSAAQEAGCLGLQACVLQRAPAVAFYRRLGCTVVGESLYPVDDHSEVVLVTRCAF